MDRLILSCTGLVVACARRFAWSQVALEDLVQEGMIGLVKGLQRWDPERGLKVSTYATWWVRQAMNRATEDLSRNVRIPAGMWEKDWKIRRAEHHVRHVHDRAATTEDLIALTNAGGKPATARKRTETIRMLRITQAETSLDETVGDTLTADGEHSRLDRLEDPSPSQEEALGDRQEQAALGGAVQRALSQLDPRERQIIESRYMSDGPTTPAELIASVPRQHTTTDHRGSLCRERIRQLESRAIVKLRAVLVEILPGNQP